MFQSETSSACSLPSPDRVVIVESHGDAEGNRVLERDGVSRPRAKMRPGSATRSPFGQPHSASGEPAGGRGRAVCARRGSGSRLHTLGYAGLPWPMPLTAFVLLAFGSLSRSWIRSRLCRRSSGSWGTRLTPSPRQHPIAVRVNVLIGRRWPMGYVSSSLFSSSYRVGRWDT